MTFFRRYDDDFDAWRKQLERLFEEFSEELQGGGRNRSRLEAIKDRINRSIETAKDKLQKKGEEQPPVVLIPAVDISQGAEGLTLYIDMPGVPKENVTITFERGELVVGGKAPVPDRSDEAQIVLNEIPYGDYQRRFLVPDEFDADKAGAVVKDGVLTITIPRSEAVKPRKVEIGD
ncbi:Hsp20/alpha crystallin family protein [bacterium]|nr:Hsp20/alpha crystallin family protein [candidate division CSSED10-310 bacterium]